MIHISKHSGKLENIYSISTSTLNNEFCMKMSENKESICSKCYAQRYEKLRKTLRVALEKNDKLAQEDLEEVPFINARFVRINAFGELINEKHFENIIRIANANKHCTFSLFTKRTDIVMKYSKQENIIYVASSPIMNKRIKNKEVINFFDKIFTVYSKDEALDKLININCGKHKCYECLKCYTSNDIKYINELVK